MDGQSTQPRKAQLDKEEREHLEDIVIKMRDRVEANVRYQLEEYNLEERPNEDASLSDEKQKLVEAIELEVVDGNDWEEGYEQYITGVGYTIINRLAGLRCMEVRNFIDEEVTVFREDGLTPAAGRAKEADNTLTVGNAILQSYHDACDELADEIEILFDRSTAYSLIDPDDDTFEDLCGMLDEVADEVWRADDVLGWIYEYYNVKLLDDLRRKSDREGLEPEDVPAANQFYTPHWVVRMLTDNSLGKLYLEHTGELQDVVDAQEEFAPDERKNRPLSPDESSDIADFCTYLVPSEEGGEPTDFGHPKELRVIDPACGSGHFLLYAFDVLERIWRAETELDVKEIPRKILRHNLYGVDLDMRACQLAAFNLYLKGRTRAAAEGDDGFDMPEVGIVCADAKVADVEGVEEVFEEVAGDDREVQYALDRILEAFEEVHGLGSLLDVRGTLGDLFEDDADVGGTQLTLGDDPRESHTLGQVLHSLREAVEEHREDDSFLAQDLRSFIRLLDILAQEYDVALMNPPYGGGGKMPDVVQEYVREKYEYKANFYVSFFEVCERLSRDAGRIGMLIPRSFLYKGRFTNFRTDFVGSKGGFDFLAEFGLGVLDNATVRTVGSVVRAGNYPNPTGRFYRLYDLPTAEKEAGYVDTISQEHTDVQREFTVDLEEFSRIPRTPICYSTPSEIRSLYSTDQYIDAEQAGIEGNSVGSAVSGLVTGKDGRFVRRFWETEEVGGFQPLAYGGSDAWITPKVQNVVEWGKNGSVMKRSSKSVRTPNDEFYGDSGLTWTRIKDTARRFGYYGGGLFETSSFMLFAENDNILWHLLTALNSDLYNTLFLSQTPEKEWDADVLGCLPWLEKLEQIPELAEAAKEQYEIVISQQMEEPTSPYYVRPSLHPASQLEFFYDHQHTKEIHPEVEPIENSNPLNKPIREVCRKQEKHRLRQRRKLERLSKKTNKDIFDAADISQEARRAAETEIFLRTSGSAEIREVPDPESVPEVPENLNEQVKDLIHHFAMEAVREESDGIIPVEGTDEQADILDRIVERFEDAYGEHAEDRLVEVDDILGAKSAATEDYPNLRAFVEDDLFAYHIDTMENTPIIWKLSTERLLADAKGDGFACFVDYHHLDASLFDRLSAQYLEPRKAELRERRAAANQQRNDESLSTSDRADATDEFEFYSSALEQIAELEEVMQELGSTSERDFDDDNRERVYDLAPKVATFREETAERIETLAELREMKGEEWFQDTFSDGFWDKVDDWRDEWLDALEELEHACEEYAKPSDEPVEAHLADLFDYFNWRLKGSDHYSSTGILFMTYYFEREGSKLLNEDGEPFDNLTEDEEMLASLATGVDDASVLEKEYLQQIADDEDVDNVDNLPPLAEFKALAEEIDDRCQTIYKHIPSDWEDRALSEIKTFGYQPNHKHGVAVNITPLAEKSVVPEIVEDKVL